MLYDIKHPRFRALVVRKNADDLRDWIDRAARFYRPTKAVVVGNPPEIRWPSGAICRTGHLKDSNAYQKYQGHEYHRMLIEELTHIPTEENYLKLIASCRSTIPELRPQVFATTNPDGPGFTWVKKRWSIVGSPKQTVTTVDPVTGLTRVFVPARVNDNPHLVNNDPNYLHMLEGLPDGLREAWKDGSWDEPNIKGAYYALELLQARKENRIGRVPRDLTLPVYTVWDLGVDDANAIGFYQRTKKELNLVHYYENEGVGLPHYAAYLQQIQREKQWIYGGHFAPFDIKTKEWGTGKTRIETAREMALNFEQVPMLGFQSGILQVRLMWPRLNINEPECEMFLNAARQYRKEYDEEKLIFKDSAVHDWTSHAMDMLRYTAIIENRMGSLYQTVDEAKVIEHENDIFDPYAPI